MCVYVPTAVQKSPPLHKKLAVPAVFRGPAFSAQLPKKAVVTPSPIAAAENIGTTLPRSQSLAAGATTPSVRHSGALKVLHAYTAPTLAVTKVPAGTANQRLKPSGATERSRSKKPMEFCSISTFLLSASFFHTVEVW